MAEPIASNMKTQPSMFQAGIIFVRDALQRLLPDNDFELHGPEPIATASANWHPYGATNATGSEW